MHEYNFAWAFSLAKNGTRVRRIGWNGSGMWMEVKEPGPGSDMTHPYLVMNIPGCTEGVRKIPWQPAQVDIFATDWEEV